MDFDSRPLGTQNAAFINQYGDNHVVQYGPIAMPTYATTATLLDKFDRLP
jgi:hypothetical protein